MSQDRDAYAKQNEVAVLLSVIGQEYQRALVRSPVIWDSVDADNFVKAAEDLAFMKNIKESILLPKTKEVSLIHDVTQDSWSSQALYAAKGMLASLSDVCQEWDRKITQAWRANMGMD